jgi:ribose transport system substrate-binding protein
MTNIGSISYGSPPYSGALALKVAVRVLQGHNVPKLTILPLPVVTNATIKLGTNPAKGANVFPPKLVPPTITTASGSSGSATVIRLSSRR